MKGAKSRPTICWGASLKNFKMSGLPRSCCRWPRGGSSQYVSGGTIWMIVGSPISLWVHYCKRDKVYFATLLWQNNGRQNGLISRMLFSELFKIMVKKAIFAGFRGRSPQSPPCTRPWGDLNKTISFLVGVLSTSFARAWCGLIHYS